jgi:hypothetical protein
VKDVATATNNLNGDGSIGDAPTDELHTSNEIFHLAGREVIKHANSRAVGQQGSREMAADEPGAASD